MFNLGKPPDRRGPNKVTSLVVDLVKKIEDLQNDNKVPCFVIDLLGLTQIPKSGNEEANKILIAEKIRRPEIKLLRIDQTLSEHDEDIIDVKMKIKRFSGLAPSGMTPDSIALRGTSIDTARVNAVWFLVVGLLVVQLLMVWILVVLVIKLLYSS